MENIYTLPTLTEAMKSADKNVDGSIVGIEWAGTVPVLLIDKDGEISMQRIDDYGIYRFSPVKNNK
jgi:hypothetical protein